MSVYEYRTFAREGQGLLRDRGSRFVAYAHPIPDEQAAQTILAGVRAEHHAARHVCYAYLLGADGSVWRASDDGEPSGTGGRPILAALRSNGLTFAMIAVARYFGGVKLGVPGLIAAYRGAAEDAIAHADIVGRTLEKTVCLRFGYDVQHEVMRHVKGTGGRLLRASYDALCQIEVVWPAAQVSEALALLAPLVQGVLPDALGGAPSP